jgi:enterochelin esterase family protein
VKRNSFGRVAGRRQTDTEYTDRVESAHLGNRRRIWIRPPLNRDAAALTIFLDGEMYRDRVGAPWIIRDLGRRGEIADSWFVFVSSHTDEARSRESSCYPPFAQFIGHELMPQLRNQFPALRHVTRNVIAGLSYTGLAAAYVAMELPGLFQRVICQSGSFWWNDCWLIEAYRRKFLQIPLEFYLEVGRRETQQTLHHGDGVVQRTSQIDAARRFRDVLEGRRIPVRYAEFNGSHDFRCWRKSLPDALNWALPEIH